MSAPDEARHRAVALLVGAAVGCLLAAQGCSPAPSVGDGGGGGGGGTDPDSGVDSGTPGGGDAGLPRTWACTTFTTRRCEYLRACGLIPATEAAMRACVSYFTATWCGPTRWSSRVDPGVNTLKYDPVLAQACADAFTTADCAAWASEPEACTRFLKPNAQLGSNCFDGYAECVVGVCRGAACPRSCQPRGALGDVCRVTSDCGTGLFCRPSNITPGVGQCAAYGTAGLPCDATQPCAAGLGCVQGACRGLPAPSEPCLEGRCDETAFCAAADGGLCVMRRDAGAGCSDDVQCVTGTICEPLTGRCEPLFTAPGAACGPRQTCLPAARDGGAACLGLTASSAGECGGPRGRGAKCVSSSDCAANLACDPGTLLCEARGGAGRVCSVDRDCAPFLTCLSQTCTALPTVSEPCTATRRCLWGTCLTLGDGGWQCVEPLGPGASCTADTDCASDRCEQGLCLAACVP